MLAAALLLALSAQASTAPVRGVVLISLDTVRGDRFDRMSRLESWARGGVVFDSAFTEATYTLPAHASMLTGLYPSANGAGGRPPNLRAMTPQAPRLAKLLRAAGFATAGFYSGEFVSPKFGFGEGFDVYEHERFDGRLGDVFARARAWLEGREPKDGKFFLFVHSFPVHRYLLATGGLDECKPVYDYDHPPHFDRSDDPRCANLKENYDKSAKCVDEPLGDFLSWLDSSGAGRDALVVVTSDHGEALCDGQLRSPPIGHSFPPYDSLSRVILAARWPDGRFAGARAAGLIQHVDLAPMILESAGVRVPKGLDGVSPLAALAATAPWPRSEAIFDDDRWVGVRTAAFKLIDYEDGARELYDLKTDPGERRELSAERPKELAAMLALDRRFRKSRRGVKGERPGASAETRNALKAEGYLPNDAPASKR